MAGDDGTGSLCQPAFSIHSKPIPIPWLFQHGYPYMAIPTWFSGGIAEQHGSVSMDFFGLGEATQSP